MVLTDRIDSQLQLRHNSVHKYKLNKSEASEDYRLELDPNPSISDAADGWNTLMCLE